MSFNIILTIHTCRYIHTSLCWQRSYLVKAMVFPVVMYECESWTMKKTKHQRIDAFELWCWRRLLRVPWTGRRSNQTILKEISSEYSLEVLLLKLKLHYFGHLMQRPDSLERPSCWERLKAGGEGDDRGWNGCMASLIRWAWVWASSGSWWRTGKPGICSPWDCKEWDTTEWLNWTEQRGFPGGASIQNLPANAGDIRDADSISGLGRLSGGGNGNPLQHSCLENPHGQRSVAGYSPQDCKVSDTSEVTEHTQVLRTFLIL